jgi:hypothetical protein
VRGLRGEEEGGGVRSGPGADRTILLFHIISARPSKQPRMVRTFLKVHTRPRLAYTHCGVEVTESSTNKSSLYVRCSGEYLEKVGLSGAGLEVDKLG